MIIFVEVYNGYVYINTRLSLVVWKKMFFLYSFITFKNGVKLMDYFWSKKKARENRCENYLKINLTHHAFELLTQIIYRILQLEV